MLVLRKNGRMNLDEVLQRDSIWSEISYFNNPKNVVTWQYASKESKLVRKVVLQEIGEEIMPLIYLYNFIAHTHT